MNKILYTLASVFSIACGPTGSHLENLKHQDLSPPRICETDTDLTCVVGQAVDLYDGADPRLTKKISVGGLVGQVKASVSEAMEKINGRNFPGTDYVAEVYAVYEIYRSLLDREVIAYAVLGYGHGEPDYQDTILIGIDLLGNASFEIEENH
jgi:hypothetical protein